MLANVSNNNYVFLQIPLSKTLFVSLTGLKKQPLMRVM